jgi:spore germination cell wall hydrolase CwlJ-like protein
MTPVWAYMGRRRTEEARALELLHDRWPRLVWAGIATLLVVAAIASGRGLAPGRDPLLMREAQAYAARGMTAATGFMTPAEQALAARHDPTKGRHADLWGRPLGWARLDLGRVPNLGFAEAQGPSAEELNALRPFAGLPIRPMKPFVLQASGEDRERAVQCLTQAVYYEAAREPEVGQEAVAQVVLNRLRHPAYPKSVCGVVYQGAARATGCQFTFTCDGALRYAPEPTLWKRARMVAERALNGFVYKPVGSATHYHAEYVAPYWAPTLVKMTQVGQHIFYRWTGPWGEPAAFTGHYAGGEAHLTPAVLGGVDARTQGGLMSPELNLPPVERKVTLAVAGETRTYSIVDPTLPAAERARMSGVLLSSRRQPTSDEIKRINESLANMERSMDSKPSRAPSAGPQVTPAGG